ncbi:fasciclin domain-containing protein [Aeoliella sp.]|uniref:fasciclin domain-containing protein n=1 Tax=Aeoliella sp. TaxID=2795800 RepID=UPI003CCBD9B9
MFPKMKSHFALAALTGVLLLPAATVPAADIVETAVSAGQFNTLVTAVKAADLVETLQGEGPFTVFAPTDEAFAAIPKETLEALLKPEAKKQLAGVLLYHVVPGKVTSDQVTKVTGATTANGQRVDVAVKDGKVMIDGATVVKTDIQCDNGVIHVIDAVILPESRSLPEVASDAEAFSTLLAAAKAAGLVEALSGDDELTVFAPTDDAFAALPADTVKSLLKPENKDKLKAILTYHVVPGRVYSTDALKAGDAKTLQGGEVTIAVEGESAMVNDAKLLKTDIDASNGVIHVIDKVLLPSDNNQQSSSSHASDTKHVSATASPCPVAAARAKAAALARHGE